MSISTTDGIYDMRENDYKDRATKLSSDICECIACAFNTFDIFFLQQMIDSLGSKVS